MKKIPTLFVRNLTTHELTDQVHPAAGWVMDGDGLPTRKFDGTSALVREGRLFKRLTLRKGQAAPPDFERAQEEPDDVTGELPGWIPIGDGKDDEPFHEAAVMLRIADVLRDGTYELVGPKVNGNPEGEPGHRLVPHGAYVLEGVPLTFEGLRTYFAANSGIEGIVWHHGSGDGRMVKLKGKDFGIRRVKLPVPQE